MDNKEIPEYKELVKKWKIRKNEMLENADETSIYRWNTERALYRLTRPNKGKEITDTNPYVNLIDVEEFDISIENEPYYEVPSAWGTPEGGMFFLAMHKEVTGDSQYYLSRIGRDKKRQIMEWDGINVPKPSEIKEENLEKLKKQIIEYANTLGFSSVGVTKLDRRMMAPKYDEGSIFDTLILLGYEMPKEIVSRHPNPKQESAAFNAYSNGGENVHKVADFIRSNGYDCRARVSSDGAIKYSPHIVNAGLGNYSTYGCAISPVGGSRYKYTGILIDAELPLDSPRDWNIEEFCARCRMCQKSCPAQAIPKEEGRYRGGLKRQTRHAKCYEYMATSKECIMCVRVCPFSMIGYEKSMESLPQYYMYNLEKENLNTEFLLQKRTKGEK